MTHPHAPPEATPRDAAFLRVLLATFCALFLSVAALTVLVDPLGRFGTGLLPPVVTDDREEKARLFLSRQPRPELIILGSSRSKTIAPACLAELTGQAAFNFSVNGAAAEDLLAIARFAHARGQGALRTLVIGMEPEMLQPGGAFHPRLTASTVLGRFVPGGGGGRARAADFLGWQAVSAAAHSLVAARQPKATPWVTLEADGLQRYPRVEEEIRAGVFDGSGRVAGSIAGILGRYESFPVLDSARVGYLRTLAQEARQAGLEVSAFIPPVHPAFARAAARTAWPRRTEEAVALLQGLERDGLLRYVETRTLPVDTMRFVDALHFLGPVAAIISGTLTGRPAGCALQ